MSEDTIYRNAAIDEVEKHYRAYDNDLLELIAFEIKRLPSAQPESRREWYMKGYREAQDAALHESCTDCTLYDHDKHRCPRFNKVIPTTIQEILDTQTQRWISCSERMPEVGKSVLICDTDGDICIGHRTRSGYYFPDFCDDKIKNVRAWAELPEPYREEDQDELHSSKGQAN